ncbi:dynein axonemal heavy chain 2-like isoform X2 [Sycon ciliatum]|uniref:dynein axonemal heavy chain 2-like isoform X2 n=1 Tax=Sycon ciliatum TaxID=27933 RepID=UPI0031F5F84C
MDSADTPDDAAGAESVQVEPGGDEEQEEGQDEQEEDDEDEYDGEEEEDDDSMEAGDSGELDEREKSSLTERESTGSSAESLDTSSSASPSDGRAGPAADNGTAAGRAKIETPRPLSVESIPPAEMVQLIKPQIRLSGYTREMWQAQHDETVKDFFTDTRLRMLCLHICPRSNELVVSCDIPLRDVDQLQYFIRPENYAFRKATFHLDCHYGLLQGNPVESLLRRIQQVYAPHFFAKTDWPEGIKSDFSLALHRVMASLTDAINKPKGHTVLYLPQEQAMELDPKVACKDKALMQRLDVVVNQWTRQIKELLTNPGGQEGAGGGGPLSELDCWSQRCDDLSGIRMQLQKHDVRKVREILDLGRSHYLPKFITVIEETEEDYERASSNLKYLSLLKEPCEKLEKSPLSKVPSLLPTILQTARVIWVNSPHYNTTERLTILLRKVSNSVIQCCAQATDLAAVFAGDVPKSMAQLNDCIEVCKSWKKLYQNTSTLHRKASSVRWLLDESAIFAHVDAFVQRCNDLKEVCEGQRHFGRWGPAKRDQLPCFHGTNGPHIAHGLTEVEHAFDKVLEPLAAVKAYALDVKATGWQNAYNRFRLGVKDLEVMVQNLMTSAFQLTSTVAEGVDLLEVFFHFSTRESIRRTLDKTTMRVYELLQTEVAAVKEQFVNKSPAIPPTMPYYAGRARWARSLKERIDRPVEILRNATFIKEELSIASMVEAEYDQLAQVLDEFVTKMYGKWISSIDKALTNQLDVPLLRKSPQDRSLIDMNFNGKLLKLFSEIDYWARMKFDCPHYIQELYSQREDLRKLRENVLLVVRDYNRILRVLSKEERMLFGERIRNLNRKIHPGFTKLTWSKKGQGDTFITECRSQTKATQALVDAYKLAEKALYESCQKISELLLFKVDPHHVYEEDEFKEDQQRHRTQTQQKIHRLHSEIVGILERTYLVCQFVGDSSEIKKHWMAYLEKMDSVLEEACRLNVKWSLQELSHTIQGDKKTPPRPLIRVYATLEETGDGPTVGYMPSLKGLHETFSKLASCLPTCMSVVQRLPQSLLKIQSTKKPIASILEADSEMDKFKQAISAGVIRSGDEIRAYVTEWDEHRDMYRIQKDSFIRRYKALNQPISAFEADISRYNEVSLALSRKETVTNIQSVVLDLNPLCQAINDHVVGWVERFISLLNSMAMETLNGLHSYMAENTERMTQVPKNLDELTNSMDHLEVLRASTAEKEEEFEPLLDRFRVLENHEFEITPDVRIKIDSLDRCWKNYLQCLDDSDAMLKQTKESFRAGLLQSAEELKRNVMQACDDFQHKGPYSNAVSTQDALGFIANMRETLRRLNKDESDVRRGLGLFKIDQPPSKEMSGLEKDLDLLESLWALYADWENSWAKWKVGGFADLETDSMELQAQQMLKKATKLGREVKSKDKDWEISESMKKEIEQFKRTMPLIQALKNSAMRQRHWDQLKEEVRKPFDETSPDFTLEKIIDLGLDQFSDNIMDISGAASKELSIEDALKEIAAIWETLNLDVGPYKTKGHHRLKGTDEVFQQLDDNQVKLSTMKASRFVKAFESQVDKWERTLSLILEVTEITLTVQRQWMYLENIFVGEDIRKQLPDETKVFDSVNENWKEIMCRMNNNPNALQATHHPGLLDQLNKMNVQLEEIQKSLDMYLETKRQVFPRFYFLSNDDLLEILGQSKNPEAVQPHLKKCFDNIKSLTLRAVRQKTEASAMHSSEGEMVPFNSMLMLEGAVELWLGDVEKTMRSTLKDVLRDTYAALRKMLKKRDKWTKEWPGQTLITSSQIQWTADVTKALASTREKGDKKSLKLMKKAQIAMLEKFSGAIRTNLTKLERSKIVALVTIEVHARDVLEKLIKSNIRDELGFDWLSQLRLYWDDDIDDCVARQTNTEFQYGYEYLGNSGRLVITPLTDRCYMTLTTALHLHRGGSPKGPAGTGKTETTKDLGKALGFYVIVVNCSEGLDFKSMGRMFSGLSQTGAWGCFDEFNRINIEVLSVVAQQILSILSALARQVKKRTSAFMFEGREIRLVWSCGVFITMNPGYAGRTELPDNLKSMFRPIAMMVPDSGLIAEIILFGEGFQNTKVLARKVQTLYSLAVQQLSKQDHYDFGLRALVSVLRYAGRKKRVSPTTPDDEVLLLAMKDMNIAKLTAADTPLFNGIVSDLFPGIETPQMDYSVMLKAIEAELRKAHLQVTPNSITKVIQLFETKNSRHSVMIVGETGSGKSTTWRILQSTLGRLKKETKDPAYNVVKDHPINPKSLSLGELYGEFDLSTNEWTDGVLSSVMRQICADEKPDEKWLLFDAPVDTLWIESMNSVMDDNKVLTLINGERISMPPQVSLLFETQDLSVASPATVSRCGMVYMDYSSLGYRPYVESWLQRRTEQRSIEPLRRLFDKHVPSLLEFKRVNCKETIPVAEINSITSLCTLVDALATAENGVNASDDEETYLRMLELWFLFSVIWSIAASVDEQGRKKIDAYYRELEGQFPAKDSIYEYQVDVRNKGWVMWEEQLRSSWRYPANSPFYKIMVPTVDTVRYDFLVHSLISTGRPVLMTGPVGTGKTSVAGGVLQKLDSSKYNILMINMSAQTTSNNVQEIIESRVEKRTKGVFVPIGGKKLLTFMDDLNMPAKDTFGSQPPLELVRQWMDYGFWYDRLKQVPKTVKDMFLMAAMGPPGGGRTHISRRLQSRFSLINMTFPQDSQIKRIFGTMITQKLQDFEEDVKPVGPIITQATLEIYQQISTKMLPTPAKIHYLFNLRDISKVFQGLLRANKNYHDTKNAMIRLWIHESYRVFADRLIDDKDREGFQTMVSERLGNLFDVSFNTVCPNKVLPVFGDFMRPDLNPPVYEDLTNPKELKNTMENSMEDYNMTPGVIAMNLVLFRDAIEHVCRIVRVIRQPRGNMLLVGVGGSGRQSLARLSSSILEYNVFQIEISRHYRLQEFREDLRRLYYLAGVENKPTVFLFNDTQVVMESFLEDINNILSSGEVPNLYKPDEFEEVRSALSSEAAKAGVLDLPDTMFAFLVERVRNNLHIVLCMSPVGEPFRNRLRQYPGLVNCTTIDWFTEWPKEALQEVAQRYLEDIKLGDMSDSEADELRLNLASIFVTMHRSVGEASKKMLAEMKRHNYVTPTSYLELVSGYKLLLEEKRKELGDAASKLRNGLLKLDETRTKVESMSVELEEKTKQVAQFQKECEEYLIVLVQQKREADDQKKMVAARGEKIAEEEKRCKAIAEAAQKDLAEAIPALEAATEALKSLNKTDMTEVRSYTMPPPLVERVMDAVMILKGEKTGWPDAKRAIGEGNFINSLINFNKENISDKILKKIGSICSDKDFQPDNIGRVSFAAKSLCMWVRAMEVYGRIYRVVEPKKKRLADATVKLEAAQASLKDAQQKLKEVEDRVEDLKRQYDEKLKMKEELKANAEMLALKLDRAGKLVSGLAGERVRWEANVLLLEEAISYLVGDCLMAAAFMSYAGPFLSNYRDDLVENIWLKKVRELRVPCNPDFSFSGFLGKATTVRQWNIQGLPSDSFSTENGVVVTRGRRWPLMVDPQGQAIKWIKHMEKARDLRVIDLQQADFLRTLENAVQFGTPVLLQNVQEELDPSLGPVLNKSIIKQGGRYMIRLGDKEVEYNPDFKFYVTTKLSNPHYTPEIATKTTIVNFAVKEQGLEAQLLGIVVRKEKPELEMQKDTLVVSIAEGKRKLEELEDKILRLLSTAQGSLLDDEDLVKTLQSSKITSEEVTKQLEVSEVTEKEIDAAREQYRPCAKRASILFFVLNDMGRIDPMYQFSLDAYIELFNMSIDKSPNYAHFKLANRIKELNNYHTYAVYRYTCRGLFERHKLLFSFHMCAKIMEAAEELNMDDYHFFLRGGVVIDRETQVDNPTKWLPESAWDNITELDKLPNFHGMINSFEMEQREWNAWYTSAEPEKTTLPGEWDRSLNELQKMLIVRSIRPDRVTLCSTTFIINNLGVKFTEPPVLDMKSVVEDSTTRTPLIFVLSSGVDPTNELIQLATSLGMLDHFDSLSLGQGQAPIATRMLQKGVKQGNWVFLANCHLSLSWMPQLDKIVEQLQVQDAHPDFRLWLSSTPHPQFPISILQVGIKMTTEPPKGLKANMKRLYGLVTEDTFYRCRKRTKYQALLFGLCFFHSVLIERRKFLMLGWNVIYGFNNSDYEVSESLISIYLDEYDETPWDALKYLVAGVMYGGHVTDDIDRRLLTTYINDTFQDKAVEKPFYLLSSLPTYYIPKEGELDDYKDYINGLPNVDHPEAFGQHPNADIASQIIETRNLLGTLLSLRPQVSDGDGESQEDKVLSLAADVLKRIPENIDYEATLKLLADDPAPLNVVLLQEIQRYNALLDVIRTSLVDLQKGIKGLVVMSSDLEQVLICMSEGKVPPLWEKAYPSHKPLGSWTRDLVARVEQFAKWAETGHQPIIFWMSGFTFPTGFLTAILQTCARRNNVSVDSLQWEFNVSTLDDSNIVETPKDGVWVKGLYLEGAGWDKRNSHLVEANPMMLVNPVPTIHFNPIEARKKPLKGMYFCPCYYYSNRTGTSGRPSFIVGVEMKSGQHPSEHWVKRGTALLMSLDY